MLYIDSKAGRARPQAATWLRWVSTAVVAAAVAGCGGGGGGSSDDAPAMGAGASPAVGADSGTVGSGSGATTGGSSGTPSGGGTVDAGSGSGSEPVDGGSGQVPTVAPTRAEAARFLAQASFGPTAAEIDRVVALGYAGWIDDQFNRTGNSHRASWDAADAALKAVDATKVAYQRDVLDAFYREAVKGDAQLRQRVTYALSQIMVVSMVNDSVGDKPRSAAGYLDTLSANAFGSYRQLIEAVALHPAMGMYLSHIRNQKESVSAGRVPDENFAREVMQLFSIGLYQLEADGTRRADGSGSPIATYTHDDIEGLAKVFTGWSWAGPDTSTNRFWAANGVADVDRHWKPMQGYALYHSNSEKRFLGTVVAAQGTAQPSASLKAALDTLAAHPNVGPFLARQMIQRLVTSHPSPAYVSRVAGAFKGGGGDLKAMVKAVLLDTEARSAAASADVNFGKVREPVLRLTAALRAFGATSDSGSWLIGATDDPASSLGQTPMRSSSVFNFYRPGYVAPGTRTGAAGLTAPELQLTHESSVAGYANYMRTGVQSGFGQAGIDYTAARRDVQLDLSAEDALADRPDALVDQVATRLLGAPTGAALRGELITAVQSVTIPVARADGSNATQIATARRNRTLIALYLLLVSPEFIVQK